VEAAVTGRTRALAAALSVLAFSACEKLPAAPEAPDQPPKATFYFTPLSPIYAGQSSVLFNALGSSDSDGHVVTYVWDFGDGTTPETRSDPTVQHVFRPTGARCLNVTYGVSLVVSDDRGAIGVASAPVTVTELPAPTSQECQR
jgi:PKD repeat protein